MSTFRNSRSNGAGRRNSTPSESRSKFHYIGSPLSMRMIFILLHYLLSFLTVTSSAHQRFLCCVISSSTAISVPHSVPVRCYYGPLGGGGGPSLGDRPPGGGGGPSSLGWGRTRGGGYPPPPLSFPTPCRSPGGGGGGPSLGQPKILRCGSLCCCVGDCVVGHYHLYPLHSCRQDILLPFPEMELDSTTWDKCDVLHRAGQGVGLRTLAAL